MVPTKHCFLSFREARRLAFSHQNLVGLPADGGKVIIAVCTGPWDEINKFIFLYFYRDCLNVDQALQFYRVPFYDVLLLLEDEQRHFSFTDLRAYLANVSIKKAEEVRQ